MTLDSEFDRHTAVEVLGEGRYGATLDAGWGVGGGLNGGYLLAVIGSAVRAHLPGKPDPVAVSAHYLGPGIAGPAVVEVTARRDGGRFATVSADLVQEGRTRITTIATYGDLDALPSGPDDIRTTAVEPELPPVEDCYADSDASPEMLAMVPLIARLDRRYPKDDVGWVDGKASGKASISCWCRLTDDRPFDPVALLLAVDVLPPVTFPLGMPGWAPTLELTVHVRARPAPGWLKLRHETRNLAGGLFEEDCEVWDSAGRLVAQSRQLALVPRA